MPLSDNNLRKVAGHVPPVPPNSYVYACTALLHRLIPHRNCITYGGAASSGNAPRVKHQTQRRYRSRMRQAGQTISKRGNNFASFAETKLKRYLTAAIVFV